MPLCPDLLIGKKISHIISESYVTDWSMFRFRSFAFKIVGDIKSYYNIHKTFQTISDHTLENIAK
jgi:hypothetical protein